MPQLWQCRRQGRAGQRGLWVHLGGAWSWMASVFLDVNQSDNPNNIPFLRFLSPPPDACEVGCERTALGAWLTLTCA